MNCSDFIEGFSDYVDGAGPSDFLRDADGHVRECTNCRRYLEVFERGRTLLRSLPRVEVSDDFHPRLRHRIFHIEDGEALTRAGDGSAATAAIALMMALLMVLAAWSPVLLDRAPVVELSPIVVSRTASPGLGLRAVSGEVLLPSPETLADLEDLWRGALLFQYSPLARRAGQARVQRAGLD